MSFGYIDGYFEEDYFEEDLSMAIDALPTPPSRSMEPPLFIEAADLFLSKLPTFAQQCDMVGRALTTNSTNSTSTTSNTIASTGSKTFVVEIGKSYVVGNTVKAASAVDGTVWMQGDVTAYDSITGSLTISMTSSQGSGTLTAWVLSLALSVATPTGSLTSDFTVKSLRHAIGANVASATTIDLSNVGGNLAHLTGNTTITGATMISGKDVWLISDGTPQLTYHATNLKLNSGGANVTLAVGDAVLFTFDGTVTMALVVRANGKAIVETAAPAGAPIGSFLLYAGSSAPAGYLICPTSLTNISRTTYAALFAAIGTTWGAGDSSTTFGLPWFASGYALIQASSNVGTTTVGANLAHTHTYEDVDNTGTPAGGTYFTGSVGNTGTKTTSSSGGSANLAAGTRILICIKYA